MFNVRNLCLSHSVGFYCALSVIGKGCSFSVLQDVLRHLKRMEMNSGRMTAMGLILGPMTHAWYKVLFLAFLFSIRIFLHFFYTNFRPSLLEYCENS